MKRPIIKEWQSIIIESLIKNYNANVEYYSGLSIVTYIDNQIFYLKIFKDSASRYIVFCKFDNEEERKELINKYTNG